MGMKMNRETGINMLLEKTHRSINECNIIYDVLNENGIIGRKNKERIKSDFIEKLKVSEKEADKIYNICMEIVVKNFFE